MAQSYRGLPIRRAVETGRCIVTPSMALAPASFRDDVFSRLKTTLASAINVRIDNVTEYLFAGTDQEIWTAKDFPNQAPPFPVIWFESVSPTFILSKNPSERAVAIKRQLVAEGMDERKPLDRGYGVLFVSAGRDDDPPESRWEIHMHYFRHEHGGVVGPIAEFRQVISEQGEPFDEGEVVIDGSIAESMSRFDQPGEPFGQAAVNALSPVFFPVRLAISFMHCKNVKVEEQLPSRQIRRAAERKGDPIERYIVLDIMPMREVLRTEGRSESVGLQRALHICRGHFSTYTEERPLFGKYAGRFWIPSHVRGSADAGKIEKDYRVKAPRSAA